MEYRSMSIMTANSLASRILVMVKAVMKPNKIRIMKRILLGSTDSGLVFEVLVTDTLVIPI